MITSDPVGTVLAVGYSYVNMTEMGKDNHGQVVEYFLKGVGLGPGFPWCAAFVSHVGYYALIDPLTKLSHWPLARTASCLALGTDAAKQGVLVGTPQAGDVFLIYYPAKKRFAHTGLIIGVNPDGSCATIEGNTSGGGSREGWGVFARQRVFADRDRFIRWATLL